MASAQFRAGVVMAVCHPDMQQILAFERADSTGSWQLPQGGLNAGELPIDGAWRELFEETGLTPEHVALRAEHPEWLAYEWPPEVRARKSSPRDRLGQTQKWFLFDALSADIQPIPDGREFVAWKWVQPRWLIDHVVDWRRGPYERVLGALEGRPSRYRRRRARSL
ncbi:MAG: NUDIX domain-containing protein [Actinomycetia bacterium]|nr:NUDIX domain-containing protein [Actinomycetes bacterium]